MVLVGPDRGDRNWVDPPTRRGSRSVNTQHGVAAGNEHMYYNWLE